MTLGKFLIGLYLASGHVRSLYGAASSLIVLLFWIYFSALVFLFGAEFIQVNAKESRGGGSVRARKAGYLDSGRVDIKS